MLFVPSNTMSKILAMSRLQMLEDERRSRGLSRARLCDLSGISGPTYRSLVRERGSIRSLDAIRCHLGLSWSWVEQNDYPGEALAERRKSRDLTQADLATRIGCSRPTIVALERSLTGSVERLLHVLTVLRLPDPLRAPPAPIATRRALVPRTNDPEKDRVMTPRELARAVIAHFSDRMEGELLDPCCGDGAFFDQFPDNLQKHWCEVERGRDFLHWPHQVDWIITNPPWSRLRQFILQAMRLADNIVYVAPLTNFTTKARLRDLKEHGFGIHELLMLPTPRDWPQSGFQLVAAHLQRGYTGSWKMSEPAEGST